MMPQGYAIFRQARADWSSILTNRAFTAEWSLQKTTREMSRASRCGGAMGESPINQKKNNIIVRKITNLVFFACTFWTSGVTAQTTKSDSLPKLANPEMEP
jgi:hypothetical protein